MKKKVTVQTPTDRGVVSTSSNDEGLIPASSLAGGVVSAMGGCHAASLLSPSEPVTSITSLRGDERPLEVSVHWFSGSCNEFDTLESAIGLGVAFISDVLNHAPDARPTGVNGYTTTYEWNAGLKFMANTKVPEMGVFLLAPGEACEFYGFGTLSLIGQTLQISPTRLDLSADYCPFVPLDLYMYWVDDQVRTQARPDKKAKPERVGQRVFSFTTSPSGDTLHMGSKTSTQSARCYDSRGFTRFEMMLRDDRAAQVMQALYDGAELGPTVGAAINQFVAFVELDDINRSRCTPLPFWTEFMERLASNGVVTRLEARPKRTVESLKYWLKHIVSPSIATYAAMESDVEGSEALLGGLLREGQKRMRSKHYALVATCRDGRVDSEARLPKIVQDVPSSTTDVEEEAA